MLSWPLFYVAWQDKGAGGGASYFSCNNLCPFFEMLMGYYFRLILILLGTIYGLLIVLLDH